MNDLCRGGGKGISSVYYGVGVEDTLGVGMNFCGTLELLPGVRFSGVSEKDGFCSESEPNYSNSLWGSIEHYPGCPRGRREN